MPTIPGITGIDLSFLSGWSVDLGSSFLNGWEFHGPLVSLVHAAAAAKGWTA